MGRETSLVLAIEPDSTRAEALRQLMRERLGIELVLVASPYAAIVAMNRLLPELLLFSSSLSDRNQNKVIAHYRSLTDGIDPQTLIIPLFRDAGSDEKKNSRFSFKWKSQSRGASSDVFVDTVASYLKRSADSAAAAKAAQTAASVAPAVAPVAQPVVAPPPEPLPVADPEPEPEPLLEPVATTPAPDAIPTDQPPVQTVDVEASPLDLTALVLDGEEVILDLAPEVQPVTEIPEASVSPAPFVPAEAVQVADDLTGAGLDNLYNQLSIDPGTMTFEVQEPAHDDEAGVDLSSLLDAGPAPMAPMSPMMDPGIDPEVHAAEIALIKLEAEQKAGNRARAFAPRGGSATRIRAGAPSFRSGGPAPGHGRTGPRSRGGGGTRSPGRRAGPCARRG
jgi:hypothetical protein